MKLIYKLSLGVIVIAVLVVFLGYTLLGQLKKMAQPLYNDIPQSIEALDKAIYLDHLAGSIVYYDEVLTQSARNYAFTGDYKWKQRYLDAEPELERIIKFALERGSDTDRDNFKKVDTANIALLYMEHRAIALVDEGRLKEAVDILESENYTQEKNNYKTAIQSHYETKDFEYESSLESSRVATFSAIEKAQLIVLRSINLTIIFILLVFVAVFSLSTFFSHIITNALGKLRVLILNISKGNFSSRVNIKTKDEFGQLADSFNNMAEALESKTTSIEFLNREIEGRKIIEDKLNKQKGILNERVKELQCLYNISNVIETYGNSLDDIFAHVVDTIPSGFQYPDIISVRISVMDKVYATANFKETSYLLKRDITVRKQKSGTVEVCYLEVVPDSDVGPFLNEEVVLLNTICERLGRIVERKEAERELIYTKEKYKELFDFSSDAMMILSPQNGFLECNKAALTLFGCSKKEEFIGKTPDEFSTQYQPGGTLSTELAKKMIDKAIQDGSCLFEWQHKGLDGIAFEASVLLSRIDFGYDVKLQATVRDISMQKRYQEEIKQAKEYAELIFKVAPSAIYTVDKESNVTAWNSKAEIITGYKAEEIIGKKCAIFADSSCKDKYWRFASEVEKPIMSKECVIKRKDEKLRYISKNADLLRNSKGEIVGGIESFEDITDRKLIEASLKEAKEEWERTFDSISDFIFIQDRNKNIIRCNQSFADAMGLKMEEIIGKKCFEIVHKLDKPWPLCPFEETLKDKKTHVQEVDDPKVGIPLLVTTSPILDNEGNLLGIVHIAKDISKIKEVDRIKDEFVSTVSHELRTPLSITREGISLVLDGVVGDVTQDQREILTTSKNNIDRLARIINDLLDISKIESGKIQLQKINIDLIELIKNVLSSFDLKAKAVGLVINAVFNPAKINMNVDSDKIIQVMTNLMNNAIKFTKNGSIEVSVLDKGDYVECSVSDTGIGIQEKDLPNVFSKFQQFGRIPGPGDKGTGLGLSISKGIIEAHSGHIWVISKPEEGTRFTFTLPKA